MNPMSKLKEDKTVVQYIFPCILIACNVGAVIVYAAQKDFKKMFYWLFAAGINICVTF